MDYTTTFYGDDGQFYIVFDLPTDDNPCTLVIAIKKIEACVNEMRLWLAIHMLLYNNDNTELIYIISLFIHTLNMFKKQ